MLKMCIVVPGTFQIVLQLPKNTKNISTDNRFDGMHVHGGIGNEG